MRIVSNKEGNYIYFSEHGGNKIAKFSTDTKRMTEYEIPTGPLATTVFISLSNDNTKIWFTEWASNKIGYLDITKQITINMFLNNKSLSDKPLIFNKNNTSYQINVSLESERKSLSQQQYLSGIQPWGFKRRFSSLTLIDITKTSSSFQSNKKFLI